MQKQTKKTTAPAPDTSVNDAIIAKAAEETHRMGRVDKVFAWDRRQGVKVWVDADGREVLADGDPKTRHHLIPGPDVILCPNDRSHGPMVMHGSGSTLMCGVHKGGAACTGTMPVSV